MVTVTRIVGAILIAIGVVAYAVTAAASVTALIPAIVGAVLLALGLLAGRFAQRPLTVAALVVSALAVLASLMPLGDLPALLAGDDVDRPAAVVTSGLMALLCLVHIGFGVRAWLASR